MNLYRVFIVSLAIVLTGRAEDKAPVLQSLTMQDCISRALQNNLEIKFERINPTIQSWGVIGAQGVYDPLLSGSVTYQDSWVPRDTSQVFTNALTQNTVITRTLQPDLSLGGKLPTGATYDFSSQNTRYSGNAISNFLYIGQASANISQPILKNFGLGINSAQIRVARKSHAIAQQNFIQVVMNKIAAVSTAYNELIFTIEDHRAKLQTLEQAKELLDQTRKRAEIGTQSPLDVIQAEAGAAENVQAVIASAQAIKDAENALKRLISQQVTEFRGVSLVPTDFPVAQATELDVTQSVRTALEKRPDYMSARHAVERQNILVQFNHNQLWPEIDLQGSYGVNGRGTTDNNYQNSLTSDDFPVWSAGVTISFPLGNRQARSSYHIAKLDADQALISLKALEQDIIVQVEDAVGHVGSSVQAVEAARAATRLAEASLDAENKKLLAGSSTTFLVLQAQAQLGSSRSAEVRARASYSESLVALDLAEGTILQKNNIVLEESR